MNEEGSYPVLRMGLMSDGHDPEERCRQFFNAEVVDGWGFRLESGRRDEPTEIGAVVLIASRIGGAFYANLTPAQARELGRGLLAAAENVEEDAAYIAQCETALAEAKQAKVKADQRLTAAREDPRAERTQEGLRALFG